ncbi:MULTISPECIES: hypothetical protein [Acidiplasma]|jgi:ABC-type dipeptide/oligopeptide/nickel transport system ATPase component|nr:MULTISPECIES: hypothetical protein [Acidiplasma]
MASGGPESMERNNPVIKFNNFSAINNKNLRLYGLNHEIMDNESVLLIFNDERKDLFMSIFYLNADENIKVSGTMEILGEDVSGLINRIKRYSKNDKNLMAAAYSLKNVFIIPEHACELFDKTLKIKDQIIDFIPYSARVRILNAVLRRETFSREDIKLLMDGYKKYPDTENYLRYWATEYGVINKLNEIKNVLERSEEPENELMEIMLLQKKGIDLANIVELRDFYRFKDDYVNIYYKKNSKYNYSYARDKIRIDMEKKNFRFFNLLLRINRHGIEHDLNSEINAYILEYLKYMNIKSDTSELNKYPHEVDPELLKHILLAIYAFSDVKLLIIEEPGDVDGNLLKNVNILSKTFKFATLAVASGPRAVIQFPWAFNDVCVIYAGMPVEKNSTVKFNNEQLHPFSMDMMSGREISREENRVGCPYFWNCKYAMDICKDNKPAFTDYYNGRVACFLYSSLKETNIMY